MRKIQLLAVAFTVALGVLAAPISAGTASASEVYNFSGIERCFNTADTVFPGQVGCMTVQAFSSYTSTQIWINGKVGCFAGETHTGTFAYTIGWCGVGGGNGTAYLNIGVNWYWPNLFGSAMLYERMNIYSNDAGCVTWGYNAGPGWSNNWLTCEEFLHYD
jgi:hypothetical protein